MLDLRNWYKIPFYWIKLIPWKFTDSFCRFSKPVKLIQNSLLFQEVDTMNMSYQIHLLDFSKACDTDTNIQFVFLTNDPFSSNIIFSKYLQFIFIVGSRYRKRDPDSTTPSTLYAEVGWPWLGDPEHTLFRGRLTLTRWPRAHSISR